MITTIMYVEIFDFIISTLLMGFEIFKMRSSLRTPKTRTLLFFLLFLNLSYLSRAYGIYRNDLLFYTIWPAVFGVLGFMSFWYWGFLFVDKRRMRNVGFSLISLGLVLFILGALLENDILAGISVLIFFVHFIILIWQFYSYSRGTEYLLARLRIFSMTLAFVIYGFFETIAVLFMQFSVYTPAAIIFALGLIGRLMLTLSIEMPKWYQVKIVALKNSIDDISSKFANKFTKTRSEKLSTYNLNG